MFRGLPILCYHHVGSSRKWGARLNIEPSRLRSHVRFFARRGCRFICAGDLAEALGRPGQVCFTFDDAYAATVTDALSGFGVPFVASYYAVPSLVGQSSQWDGADARPLASWEDLRNLQGAGHEVGNHSYSHLAMGRLTPAEQAHEVQLAEDMLRDNGLRPRSFCFPYGSLPDDPPAWFADLGYSVGLALGKRIAGAASPIWAVPRVAIAGSDSLPLLLWRLWRASRRR